MILIKTSLFVVIFLLSSVSSEELDDGKHFSIDFGEFLIFFL